MPQRSEAIPKLLPAILKCLHVVAVCRSECPNPLSGPREKDAVSNVAVWLALFQHIVELDHIGIIGGKVELEMLEKTVFVERTNHAGAGLTVKSPLFQVVLIGILPFPPHLNERIFILEHLMPTGKRAVRFLLGKSNVQFMCLHIFRPQLLVWAVSKQLVPYKFLNLEDFVVHSTGTTPNPAWLSLSIQCPKGHSRHAVFPKVIHIVLVQVALKDIEWDTGILTGTFDEFDLVDHPDRLVPKVTIDDRIIARHLGKADRPPSLLASNQCQRCALHTGPTR